MALHGILYERPEGVDHLRLDHLVGVGRQGAPSSMHRNLHLVVVRVVLEEAALHRGVVRPVRFELVICGSVVGLAIDRVKDREASYIDQFVARTDSESIRWNSNSLNHIDIARTLPRVIPDMTVTSLGLPVP